MGDVIRFYLLAIDDYAEGTVIGIDPTFGSFIVRLHEDYLKGGVSHYIHVDISTAKYADYTNFKGDS